MRSFKPSFPFGFALLATTSYAVPYEQYILAPASRDLAPPSIHGVNGSVVNAASLTHPSSAGNVTLSTGNATFRGPSSVTFDFGRDIGGLVSLDVASVSSPDAYVGVTFSESSNWISSEASDATEDAGRDSPLWFAVGKGAGRYSAEKKHVRGGFRYLTLSTNTTATVSVRGVKVHFTAAPSQNLRAYKGYFHSDDELLNRIWYAGAYTGQLCTVDPTTGDALPFTNIINATDNITLPRTNPWYSNYTIANASSTITDGAKRDRLIWPGDMSVALESIAVSTFDLYSVRTALETLLANQKPNGQLPYAGPPFSPNTVSFTYHLHSLIGMSYYYRYSGDKNWLLKYWRQYKRGLQWALSSVDSTGMANITAQADWLRFGMGAHNIEANALLYSVLNQAQTLSKTMNDTSFASNFTGIAAGIKSAANKKLWDSKAGLYYDNETTTLHPQDGNVWAVKANLTLSDQQNEAISSSLTSRWGPYGAPAPEAGKTVSPFISAFELHAHYMAGEADRALDLLRLQWGFMLDDPRMTNSTFIEGYSTDGSFNYAPYKNVPRISLAHGWSTGPTFALTNFAAGLQLTGPAGATWLIAPQPGNLTEIDAGFTTRLGVFSTKFQRTGGEFSQFSFSAPNGTTGEVRLPGTQGSLVSQGQGRRVKLVDGVATGLKGGSWVLRRN